MGPDLTRHPDCARATNETKRFPGWTHPPNLRYIDAKHALPVQNACCNAKVVIGVGSLTHIFFVASCVLHVMHCTCVRHRADCTSCIASAVLHIVLLIMDCAVHGAWCVAVVVFCKLCIALCDLQVLHCTLRNTH